MRQGIVATIVNDPSRINAYASRQYGVFSTRQLRDAGFDRKAVGRRVARSEWIRLAPGVFAVASAPPIWERQLSAAILSRPSAVVGRRSAAFLHGFKGFERNRPEIMVPWSANARSPIARVIRSSFFTSLATTDRRGFTTTIPAETLPVLAADLSVKRLEEALEESLLTGTAKLAEFDEMFDRIVGARLRGAGRLRMLIESLAPELFEVEPTYLERLLERVLADSRLPLAIREHEMSINGTPARVDAFLPEWSLVIEAGNRRWHARQQDFERDRARDNALAQTESRFFVSAIPC